MIRRRCKHQRTRCVHGDEIVRRMSWWKGRIRRQICLDCGTALDLDLPVVCTVTGSAHS